MSKKHRTTVTTVDDCSVEEMLKMLGGVDEKLNENNRPWGQALSKTYMNVMLQGRWVGLRVHVIREVKTKQIHNAQHCLKAAIMAEAERLRDPAYYAERYGVTEPITLDLIIEDGILPEWADLIDTGKGRKQSDVVYKHHLFSGSYEDSVEKKLSGWHATAAKIVWARPTYGEKVRTSLKFTFPDLSEIIANHPDLVTSTEFLYDLDMDTVNAGANGTGWLKPLNIPAAYLVAAHYFASYSKMNDKGEPMRTKEADEFFTALAYGTIAIKGNPIYELREWLLKQSGGGNEYLNRLYDAVVVAWNAWMEGGSITSKVFSVSSLKKDVHYEMGGLDTYTPPPAEEEVEPEQAEGEEVPEAEAAPVKATKKKATKGAAAKPATPSKKSAKADATTAAAT